MLWMMALKSEQPIAYASCSLSMAERKYAQIKKEGLAIVQGVYGVQRFHQYHHGRQFTIVSNHWPLQKLFNKSSTVPTMGPQPECKVW